MKWEEKEPPVRRTREGKDLVLIVPPTPPHIDARGGAMKIIVKPTAEGWRVWVNTGILDAREREIFLGDHLEGVGGNLRMYASIGGDAGRWEVLFKGDSPGLPCELELPATLVCIVCGEPACQGCPWPEGEPLPIPKTSGGLYPCTCGHQEWDHECRDEDDKDFTGLCTKCECAAYQEET